MKKILIPTDFSSVSDEAMNFAIEIGSKFKSDLLLYHVYSFNRRRDYNSDFSDDEQPFIKRINDKMNFTKRKFIDKVAEKGLSLQTKIEEAPIFSLFNSAVEENDISLIVMGSRGASGWKKVVFGSVAATALDLATVPVLVVQPHHSMLSLEQIILATDLDKVSFKVLEPLQKLAFKFNSAVTLLNVNSGLSEEKHHDIDSYLKDLELSYREVPMSQSINDTINAFLAQGNYDLLCMIRREKGFFESLFQTSITKNQVYKSEIPVLILPES
ncbi:universal stress protein [Portibacter lacus]|uniref:UspA domain-containing protein n=1 Tax=Portibacter lacus TaxID=1099794 RepID=A0AA37WD84_9BACT|nr:universal stress protein [Portibacter lacus]GLR17666.1 hypothetical protein GCM10007940_22810 [Portibacter lacus]